MIHFGHSSRCIYHVTFYFTFSDIFVMDLNLMFLIKHHLEELKKEVVIKWNYILIEKTALVKNAIDLFFPLKLFGHAHSCPSSL